MAQPPSLREEILIAVRAGCGDDAMAQRITREVMTIIATALVEEVAKLCREVVTEESTHVRRRRDPGSTANE
jgi:hypothetical protein